MIKSMTAYGRATVRTGGKEINVEIKSVNNRFLDLNIKLPRMYSHLEDKVRSYIRESAVSRGKVDIFINVDVLENEDITVRLDEAYTKSYLNALYNLRDTFELKDDISTMRVASNRDIFKIEKPEEDTEKDWQELLPVLEEAYGNYCLRRESEGENIYNDLMAKKAHLAELAAEVEALSAGAVEAYRGRLEAKLRQTLETLGAEPDEQRILTECAIFADKVAIDEEMVRLKSHFKAFDEIMNTPEPAGRKIDFLLQEMNREVNTTGSKCNDSAIAHLVVDMKAELEKIREQIQNIE